MSERIRRAIPTRFWLFAQFLAIGLLIVPSRSPGSGQAIEIVLFALLAVSLAASALPLLLELLVRVRGADPRAPRPPAGLGEPLLFAAPCAPGTPGTAQPRAPTGLCTGRLCRLG